MFTVIEIQLIRYRARRKKPKEFYFVRPLKNTTTLITFNKYDKALATIFDLARKKAQARSPKTQLSALYSTKVRREAFNLLVELNSLLPIHFFLIGDFSFRLQATLF